jgi:3',5'-cyclic AMP phosphodiesterase CpdA
VNFIHISDTHIRVTPMEQSPYFPAEELVDSGGRLRAALRRAKSQTQAPDFALFTGDLVHEGAAEDYRRFLAIVEEELRETPYFLALGNHDRRAAFWEAFTGETGKSDPYYTCGELDGLRVISLDSSPVDGSEAGFLNTEQFDFLRTTLQRPAPAGSILLLHHPLEFVYESFAAPILDDARALLEAIGGTDVRAVFSGHTHSSSFYTDGGVLFATASSTAFGVDPAMQNSMVMQNTSSYLSGRIGDGCVFVGNVEMESDGAEIFRVDFTDNEKFVDFRKNS